MHKLTLIHLKKPCCDHRAGCSFKGEFSIFCDANTTKRGFNGTSLSTSFLQVSSYTRLDLNQHLDSFLCCNKLHTASLKALEGLFPSCQQPSCLQIYNMIFSKSPKLWCAPSSCSLCFHIPPSSVMLPFVCKNSQGAHPPSKNTVCSR